MDERNYDIMNKIFEVLNNVTGFEVAMSNPKKGKMLVRHNDTTYLMTIDPVYNDTPEGKEADSKSFDEIVRNHKWIWR